MQEARRSGRFSENTDTFETSTFRWIITRVGHVDLHILSTRTLTTPILRCVIWIVFVTVDGIWKSNSRKEIVKLRTKCVTNTDRLRRDRRLRITAVDADLVPAVVPINVVNGIDRVLIPTRDREADVAVVHVLARVLRIIDDLPETGEAENGVIDLVREAAVVIAVTERTKNMKSRDLAL